MEERKVDVTLEMCGEPWFQRCGLFWICREFVNSFGLRKGRVSRVSEKGTGIVRAGCWD